jgi:hypothetical protein
LIQKIILKNPEDNKFIPMIGYSGSFALSAILVNSRVPELELCAEMGMWLCRTLAYPEGLGVGQDGGLTLVAGR